MRINACFKLQMQLYERGVYCTDDEEKLPFIHGGNYMQKIDIR